MKKVPRVRREMQTLTADEIQQVLAIGDRNRHLWYLAFSGLRRGEIAGLRWSDISFTDHTLTVCRNRVEVGKQIVENEPKTQSSRRVLPLDDVLTRELHRAFEASSSARYVASDEGGEPYTPGALTHMWRDVVREAGVTAVRLHDARHSCATAMHLRGVPIATIARWLGHSDSSFTMRTYAHSQDHALLDASSVLSQVLVTRAVTQASAPKTRADEPPRQKSAPSGFRTPDPLIKSQLLYQLS